MQKKNPGRGRLNTRCFNKEKVLTIVGAFFVTTETMYGINKNYCPFYAGMLYMTHNVCDKWFNMLRNTHIKGVNNLRNKRFCFKSENETGNHQGFIWNT
jgi:hypothetical protein